MIDFDLQIEKFSRGEDLHEGKVAQDPEKSAYYTFPTEEDLKLCADKGIRLVDGGEIMDYLVDCFGGTEKSEKLQSVIMKATEEWYADNSV